MISQTQHTTVYLFTHNYMMNHNEDM